MTMTHPKVIIANEKSAGVLLEAAKIEVFHPKVVTFGNYPGTTPFSDVLKCHDKSAVDNFQYKDLNDPRDTAVILFSSGTTGLPKGVQIPHVSLLNVLLLEKGLTLKDETPMWFSSLYWISGTLLTLKGISTCTKRIIGPDFEEKLACEIVDKYKVPFQSITYIL